MADLPVSRVFCINLDYRVDRWAHIVAQQVEQALAPIERFPAVRPEAGLKGLTIGATGAYLSHYSLYQRIVAERLAEVLILEDDAVFCPDFATRLNALMPRLPADRHMVYLGYWRPSGIEVPIDDTLSQPGDAYCLYGYLLTLAGAEQMLDRLAEMRKPIDDQILEDCVPRMNITCVRQPLIASATFSSDVRADASPAELRNLEPFRPGLRPYPIEGRKRLVLLHHPRWGMGGWREVVAAFARAFTEADDVCLVLWLDPAQGYSLARAAELVNEAVAASGADPEQSGRIVLLPQALEPAGLARLFAAADWVVPNLGDSQQDERARRVGVKVLGALARLEQEVRTVLEKSR